MYFSLFQHVQKCVTHPHHIHFLWKSTENPLWKPSSMATFRDLIPQEHDKFQFSPPSLKMVLDVSKAILTGLRRFTGQNAALGIKSDLQCLAC